MRTRSKRGVAIASLLIAGLSAPSLAQEFTESFQFSADRLVVVDLIGQVTLEGHDGSDFLVEVHVQGEDASREVIEFDKRDGQTSELWVRFPVDREDRYVYPRLGRGSRSTFNPNRSDDDSFIGELLNLARGDQITVAGSGRGLEVWADVTIKVPRDRKAQVDLGVGQIQATDVASALTLDTRSGAVEVARVTGDLSVDTGSGHVTADDVTGRISIDTGSGDVNVRDLKGSSIMVDTGSGGVDGVGLECEDLRVDTGSGIVDLASVGADDATIDTGSGSVTLELVRMGEGQFSIDTGSGGIDLIVPEGASAMVHAETGSGGIRVDVDGADVDRRDRDEVAVRIGEGGADVLLATGSGGITISQ
jgi:lia operon protein LiaG